MDNQNTKTGTPVLAVILQDEQKARVLYCDDANVETDEKGVYMLDDIFVQLAQRYPKFLQACKAAAEEGGKIYRGFPFGMMTNKSKC